MDYRLIALDMDGTLLDSGKRVRPDVSAAVREAAAAGRHVAICSGRCPSMVELSRDDLGDVVVADNDHDGVAEAIRRYLLG